MDSSENLPRQNLVMLVVNRIKEWVSSAQYGPGEKLPSEVELARLFQVSKPVIRQAISHLNALQIVETFHGRGSFVHRNPDEILLSPADTSNEAVFSTQLWELRYAFEPALAALAAKNRRPADIEELSDVLQKMQAALDDKQDGIEEDDLFHLELAKATHNPLFLQIAMNISQLSEPYKRLSLQEPFRPNETMQELKAILTAIQNQNEDKALTTMQCHIKSSQKPNQIPSGVDRQLGE